MKTIIRRLMSAWMAVALVALCVTACPGAALAATVGETTADKVNVRLRPDGDYLFRLPKGATCEITGTTKKGNTVWYKVNATDPETKRHHTGLYINGNFLRVVGETADSSSQTGTPSVAVSEGTAGRVIASGVNFRKGPSTRSASLFKVDKGTIVEILSAPGASDPDPWYHVMYNGKEGYIQGGFLQVLAQTAVGSGYVRTTKGGVNLRVRPGDSSLEQLPEGTVLPVTGAVVKNGGYDWIPVTSKAGKSGYIRGDCAVVCNASGTPAGDASSATATQPSAPAATPAVQGYLKTTTAALNVRDKPGNGSVLGRVEKKNTELPFYDSQVVSGVTWFKVGTDVGTGYVSGRYVQLITGSASVDTSGNADSTVGTGDTTMILYPVEKIDWFKGGIQEMIPKGANFKIYDIYTGTVWWAHRWSGFNHMDIEPLTAADTAKLCKMYGVSNAAQIEKNNLWQRRPCLVTVGKRTFACALYGIPHGTQTITTNNYPGQCCLHFTNSLTSGTNRLLSWNVDAVNYAYEHSPSGKKK